MLIESPQRSTGSGCAAYHQCLHWHWRLWRWGGGPERWLIGHFRGDHGGARTMLLRGWQAWAFPQPARTAWALFWNRSAVAMAGFVAGGAQCEPQLPAVGSRVPAGRGRRAYDARDMVDRGFARSRLRDPRSVGPSYCQLLVLIGRRVHPPRRGARSRFGTYRDWRVARASGQPLFPRPDAQRGGSFMLCAVHCLRVRPERPDGDRPRFRCARCPRLERPEARLGHAGLRPICGFGAARSGSHDRERCHALFVDERRSLPRRLPVIGHGQASARCALRMREIFGEALRLDARGLILAHNHPSGHCRPSGCDIVATRQPSRRWRGRSTSSLSIT